MRNGRQNLALRCMLRLANNGWLLSTVFVLDLTMATLLFARIEHYGSLDSLYWAIVTGFTVGYGDISPATDLGKVITICFIMAKWFLTLLAAAFIVVRLFIDNDKFTHEEQEELKYSMREFNRSIKVMLANVLTEAEQEELRRMIRQSNEMLETANDTLHRLEERFGTD